MDLRKEMKRAELFQVKIYRAAAHLAKIQRIESVLDIGCGFPAKLRRYFSPVVKDIVGVDLPEKINRLKQMKFGEWIAHDLDADDLDLGRKFDMIVSADVIEHLVNPNRLLEAIKRHSTVSTVILLSTPDAESTLKMPDGKPANKQHKREWKMSEFVRYLSGSGFDIIDFGCYIEKNGAYQYIANYFLCRVKK